MIKYLNKLKKSYLFDGINEEDLLNMLKCLGVHTAHYSKDEFIYQAGDVILEAGIVLSGSIHIINEDYWGNRSILSKIEEGQVFGEVYACLDVEPLKVSVVAVEVSDILFFNMKKVTSVCSSSCVYHIRLIQNFLRVLAEKSFILNQKLAHTSKRSTRDKLLSYLSEQSKAKQSAYFEIPFNRQQLADYLSVDRSALSKELCKLRDEGLLEFEKNKFKLSGYNSSIK